MSTDHKRALDAASQRKRRAMYKAEGSCEDCGNERIPNRVYCANCAARHNKKAIRQRKARIERGVCVRCCRPIEGIGLTRCPACYDSRGQNPFGI